MKTFYLSPNYLDDSTSRDLIEKFKDRFENVEGSIYYGFPTIKEIDQEPITPNLLVVIKGYGVFAIICNTQETNRLDYYDKTEEEKNTIDTNIFAKLIKNKKFAKNSRTLNFNFYVLSYYPNSDNYSKEKTIFNNFKQISDWLEEIKKLNENDFDDEYIKEVFSSLDASSAIIRPKARETNFDRFSKANVLSKMESQIASFDDSQRIAALSLLEGPQRIRGLAGTGKTIILCLKAAKLHYEYPDKKILYTFYTKSLYDYIRQLITRFYMKISEGHIPDFEKSIFIRHAWGGANIEGVYYDACVANGANFLKFQDVKNKDLKNAFDYVCNDLLENTNARLKKMYDYVLMDEAQDFAPSFYQICRQIVNEDHLIWCYDELQNIFDVKMQKPLETFKNDKYGLKGMDLKKLSKRAPEISNDIVLPRSYRNVKEILITAHCLGFGIYNDKLIQSLENNEHWEDLGYIVKKGDCKKSNDNIIIERKDENSPLKLPKDYQEDDIIETFSALNVEDECTWVVNEIIKSIQEEGLRPDDIVIITLDDKYAHQYAKNINTKLYKNNIQLNSIIDKFYEKGFLKDDAVTLSSVYKAKGNEAAMVFVVGCDAFENEKDSRAMRNKIFTAFTRAKVWLRISGISIENSSLLKEMQELKNNDYKLIFKNTPLNILERDWDENSKRIELQNELIDNLKEQIKNKNLSMKEIVSQLVDSIKQENE